MELLIKTIFIRSKNMTKYEYFQSQADRLTGMARETKDDNLKEFYKKAAEGYKIKMGNLSIFEACGRP